MQHTRAQQFSDRQAIQKPLHRRRPKQYTHNFSPLLIANEFRLRRPRADQLWAALAKNEIVSEKPHARFGERLGADVDFPETQKSPMRAGHLFFQAASPQGSLTITYFLTYTARNARG